MDKVRVIYVIILLVFPITMTEHSDELLEISQIVSESELQVSEWTVTIKEQMTSQKMHEKISLMTKKYKVDIIEDDQTFKYIIEKGEQTKSVSSSFAITIPKDNQYKAELIATIKGRDIEAITLKEYESTLSSIKNNFFSSKSKAFTCLTSINDDIIISDVFLRKVFEKLELQGIFTHYDEKSGLYDQTVYGHTELWKNEILLEDQPLNLQMVVRTDENQKQKIIIGTPILITEY